MEVGSIIETNIVDINSNGEGIGKFENATVFIKMFKNAAYLDKVKIKITEIKKNYFIGEVVEVIEESPYKRDTRSFENDGIQLAELYNIDYDKQIEYKKNLILNNLKRIGKIEIEDLTVNKSDLIYHYRNKLELKVDENSNLAYYSRLSGKNEPVLKNSLASIEIEKTLKELAGILKKYRVKTYDLSTCKGDIKNITLRSNYKGEVMLIFTVNKKDFKNSNDIFKEVFGIERVIGIFVSENKKKDSRIMGDVVELVYGKDEFLEKIGEYVFKISPKSFFQINSTMVEKLYEKVASYLKNDRENTILDLYCGVGTISIYVSKYVNKVVGVEISQSSIKDAMINKELNSCPNVEFIRGKSEDKIQGIIKDYKAETVIVDPTRKGLEKSLIEVISKSQVEKVIYVSCNPATLARDLKLFTENGFEVVEVEGYDMFPNTVHVETVALLSKLDVDKHIDVEIKLDELDLTSAESKASYAQIKEYILEKFDLKVSTLYIAQIKKKCGIVLRENYNKSKKEKQVIPQCTQEKEEAIMDALRHFKMI